MIIKKSNEQNKNNELRKLTQYEIHLSNFINNLNDVKIHSADILSRKLNNQ